MNTSDFVRLANGFAHPNAFWTDGDFNFDGVVNALDFNALATNFGSTLPAPSLGTLVPEPALFGAAIAIASLMRRRRQAAPITLIVLKKSAAVPVTLDEPASFV